MLGCEQENEKRSPDVMECVDLDGQIVAEQQREFRAAATQHEELARQVAHSEVQNVVAGFNSQLSTEAASAQQIQLESDRLRSRLVTGEQNFQAGLNSYAESMQSRFDCEMTHALRDQFLLREELAAEAQRRSCLIQLSYDQEMAARQELNSERAAYNGIRAEAVQMHGDLLRLRTQIQETSMREPSTQTEVTRGEVAGAQTVQVEPQRVQHGARHAPLVRHHGRIPPAP